MLTKIDKTRRFISSITDAEVKSQFGQYLTPSSIAHFMASLFKPINIAKCHLLDPGAGIGSLSTAFLERWETGGFCFGHVTVDAFEIDKNLRPFLDQSLTTYEQNPNMQTKIRTMDFIEAAVNSIHGNLFSEPLPKYTHAILNPPYKKIRSDSFHRAALRKVGIETVNLYSAFVALALELLGNNGQLVAIIPRSFCNGPYYKPFRKFLLKWSALQHIHLFSSRNSAFKDDNVLQENVIILLEKGGKQGDVIVSTSSDGNFNDYRTQTHHFNRIVFPDDSEQFIHVPTSHEKNAIELSSATSYSLEDIGIKISTGPVVDFRVKKHVREMPDPGCVPLLYPGHFTGRKTQWPKPGFKKPNAIQRNSDTEKWLFPNGFYTVVRRFTTKEEKRRIVASVVDPKNFPHMSMLGFENHLNVFHECKQGLPEALARGLSVYLNTSAVDSYFRRFNGHTQVNATDLKLLKYPSREVLVHLGNWSMLHSELTQNMVDEQLEKITS